MSSSKSGSIIEAGAASSNPLDVVPSEIPFDVPVWALDNTGTSRGGYSRRRGRGEDAELEDECSRGRFRW